MVAITASGKYKGMYTYWVYKGIRVMQILYWYNLNLYNYTGTTFTHTAYAGIVSIRELQLPILHKHNANITNTSKLQLHIGTFINLKQLYR